jgi:hypothetical protein
MMRLLLLLTALLLPLSGWSVWWWQQAETEKARVAHAVDYLNQYFTQSQSRLRLSYDRLEATHFFGAPQIVLHQAALTLPAPFAHRIEAPWLRLEPEGDTGEQWQLAFPPSFTAQAMKRTQEDYRFSVSPMVDVWLRTPRAQAAEAPASGPLAALTPRAAPPPATWPQDVPHQLAYRLPSTLDLTATRTGTTRTARFTFPSVPLRIWQPIPPRVDDRVEFFFAMLAELVEAPPPAKP